VGATPWGLLGKIPAVIEGIRAYNDEWQIGIDVNASFGYLLSLRPGATTAAICEGLLHPFLRGFESGFGTEPLVGLLNRRLCRLSWISTMSRELLTAALRAKMGRLFPLFELLMQMVALHEPFGKETQLFARTSISSGEVKRLTSRIGEMVMTSQFWLATTSEDHAMRAARKGGAQMVGNDLPCVVKIRSQNGRGVCSISKDGGDVVLLPPGSVFVVERVETGPSGVVIWLAEVGCVRFRVGRRPSAT
jgi:hypothetical protein